ncbi:LysR substrate-binding domain-containing protein [Streptomyces sp. NPDC003247]|uniref:LysR substrate-binding domain-containing protein n=1 Tax=Streptomyces sp. NPDC003247 TaxID=3364677 RepID=UPI0036CE3AA2
MRVHVTQREPERALPTLSARDYDLVLAEEYPGDPNPRTAGLEQEDLLDDPLCLALPRPSDGPDTAGPTAVLRSLAEHPWVMEPDGTAARRWARTLCRNAGFEPDVRFESTDVLLHLRLVERGHAAAVLPDLVRGGRPPSVPVRQLPRGQRSRRVFTVVRRGGSRHPAVLACRDALRHAVVLGTERV